MTLSYRKLSPTVLPPLLSDLAGLRIRVFAEYPYLYDGTIDYEREYLSHYLSSKNAIVIGAFDGDTLVGAATGSPMEDHAEEFSQPLAAAGLDPQDIFYCGESVLLPAYRGQGAGHVFFDQREARARELGRRHSAFFSVVRPVDHPSRPADYRKLDPFWQRRGYATVEGCIATFSWKEHGETEESPKPMQLWLRELPQ